MLQFDSHKSRSRALRAMLRRRHLHHILAYSGASGGAVTDNDTAAVVDPSFIPVNSHFIFTEQYRILSVIGLGANLSKVRLSSPTLDQFGQPNVLPLNHALNPPSPLNIADWRRVPFPLPENEEIKFLLSTSAAEQDTGFLIIAPPDWTQDVQPPASVSGFRPCRILVRTSQSITLVANSWVSGNLLTFDQKPRGGWYRVNGAWAAGTNLQAFRLNFPRYVPVNGRKLFPGAIGMASDNDFHWPRIEQEWGTWGRFHTFEPPSVDVFGSAAGAQTIRLYLDISYDGDAPYTQ